MLFRIIIVRCEKMNDLSAVLRDIEDYLFPQLNLSAWERVLYYHLLRHTRILGKISTMCAIAPLAQTTGMSDFKVREVIRTMHAKGCIQIEDRSRQGHLVRVLIPSEIPGVIPEVQNKELIDIQTLDVFSNRKHLSSLLAREQKRCFYCLRNIDINTCQLDHVVPQAVHIDNTYRNVVISCHECNTTKGETPADDFIRLLYRKGLLSPQELQNRLATLEQLQAGEIIPEL